MAQTWIIAINRKPGQALATFSPQSQTVAAGDIIYWRNNDEQAEHQIMPLNGAKDAWWDYPLPEKLQAMPAPTSQQAVSFSAATTITYVCALHPFEQGKIIVQ
jgi:plastocyanin